jgi:selenocysteine lyase/cysteine desulfurase
MFTAELSALLLTPALLPALEEKSRWREWVSESDSTDYWQKVRHEFLLPDEISYLNNGSLGLSPRPVLEAMYHHLLETEAVRTRKYAEYPWWGYGPTLEIRKTVADFIGALPEEIALTRNATEGINTVATGLDLNPGDEVLLTNQEHPGGRSAWYQRAKRYGIVVREFELPVPPKSPAEILERLQGSITSKTRVISISHITTVTGGILPAKEICGLARNRNIISLIDGAHAIGQIPLNMHDMGCDYYATSPHKWLYAPKGTGILYCRKGMAERLWCHTASGAWDQPELGCERLTNIGTSNLSLLVGMVAAIDFHKKIGTDRILARQHSLARGLRSSLSEIKGVWFGNGPPPTLSAAMVKAMLPVQKIGEFAGKLWQDHKIWVTAADGDTRMPASIRFSCSIYVTEKDLDRTVLLLKKHLG